MSSPWEIIADYARLGRRIDLAPKYGARGGDVVPGDTHPDAHVIADAIRVLPTVTRLGVAQCKQLLRHYAVLDALAVKAVAKADFSMRSLVIICIVCAILGEAMVWKIGLPRARAA
jgi:hypothetical protein